MLYDQKENAKSLSPRWFHVRSFSLLPGWREGRAKKTLELLDHTRTALENDRSIDREKHATISTLDLLALVQLGEICKNVCATIGSRPILCFHRSRMAFSFKSSFNQERVFVSRKITSLPASEHHEDTMLVFYRAKRVTDSVINIGRAKMSYGCLCFEQCTQISCTLLQITNIK